MSEESDVSDLGTAGHGVAGTGQEYRLRQSIGDGRRTITVRMPKGWIRASLSGVEGALLGWAVPALLGIFGLLTEGSNPWFQEVDVSVAASIGTDFWSLSLGAPMSVGGLPISLMPLLWTLTQILILRGLMFSGRDNEASAQWFAVPFYALTSVIILLSSPGNASVSAVLIGSALVALVSATWAVISQTSEWPEWLKKVDWLWKGLRLALIWFAVVVGIGLLALAVSLIVSWDAVSSVSDAVGAKGFATFLLALTQTTYLPVFAAWALTWLALPGFALAGGEVSSPMHVAAGPLPAFPISMAVPTSAPGGWVVLLIIACAIVTGVVCGRWLKNADIREVALISVSALFGFSALVGAWFALASGALGSELMARLGPVPMAWPTVVLEFGLVAAVSCLLAQGRAIRFAIQSYEGWRIES